MTMHINRAAGTRVHITHEGMTVWASKRATTNWAHKPGARWPCSTLAGRRLRVEYDRSGLVDLSINGKGDSGYPVDAHELDAFVCDTAADTLPADHPVRGILNAF